METKVYAEPWKRQRILKKQDIPTQEQLYNLCITTFDTLEEQALFAMAYLTAGRITEIVPCKYLKVNEYETHKSRDKKGRMRSVIKRNVNGSPFIKGYKKVKHDYQGILAQNITFETKKNTKIMVLSIQNRKNKSINRKNLPIPVEKEQKWVRIIKKYIAGMAPETPLFKFKRSKAEKILAKADMNPHFLRDIRLTHLVTIYDFGSHHLTKFAGWKDPRPAERYVRLNIGDLVDKY